MLSIPDVAWQYFMMRSSCQSPWGEHVHASVDDRFATGTLTVPVLSFGMFAGLTFCRVPQITCDVRVPFDPTLSPPVEVVDGMKVTCAESDNSNWSEGLSIAKLTSPVPAATLAVSG